MASKMATQGLPFLQRARQRAEGARQRKIKALTRQYATDIPERLPALAETGPVHLCPISSVPFSGQCPVRTCPGNKPNFETGGCLYLFYGRTKLDKSDIMFSYKLNEKRLHDSIAQGQERVLQAVGFYRTLNEIRSRDAFGYCPNCGVAHRKGVYVCDNKDLCEERKGFADSLLKSSHLGFTEVQGTRRDVYLIARELSRFQQLAQATHTNMCELLGIGPHQLKMLSETVSLT